MRMHGLLCTVSPRERSLAGFRCIAAHTAQHAHLAACRMVGSAISNSAVLRAVHARRTLLGRRAAPGLSALRRASMSDSMHSSGAHCRRRAGGSGAVQRLF